MNRFLHKQPNCQSPFDRKWLRVGGAELNDPSMLQRQVNTQNQNDIDQFSCFKTTRNVAALISPHTWRLNTFTNNNRNSGWDDKMKRNGDGGRKKAYVMLLESGPFNIIELHGFDRE